MNTPIMPRKWKIESSIFFPLYPYIYARVKEGEMPRKWNNREFFSLYPSLCVCVCVRERERESF